MTDGKEKTMNDSPTRHLDAKIQQVELRMRPIERSAKGYGYTYATLTDLLGHITPALKELGLMWTAYSSIQPAGGQTICVCTVEVVDLESGEHRESVHAYPLQSDAQKTGSYETYYRRYSLVSLLGLPIADDDGTATVPRRQTRYQRGGQQ